MTKHFYLGFLCQSLFEGVVSTSENGGRRLPAVTQLGYTKEQAEAIRQLKSAKDNYERLGVPPGASKFVATERSRVQLVQVQSRCLCLQRRDQQGVPTAVRAAASGQERGAGQ